MVKLTTDLLKNSRPAPGQARLELRDDDEPGLIFRVTSAGVRTWSIRYRTAGGEQRRKSLGTYPATALSRAREEARKLKGSVAHGADPVAAERKTKATETAKRLRTVKGLAEAYFADAALGLHRPNAKAPKRVGTLTEERRIFDRLIEPELGSTPIEDIARADVQAFVTRQAGKTIKLPKGAKKGAVPARKAVSNGRHCRTVLRQIFSYAVWKDLIEHNPAHDIAVAMPAPRERTLTDAELKAVWAACSRPQDVDKLALSPEMGMAIKFATIVLQRGGEVTGARWSEFDLVAATWTIPASRMKGKRTHLVPLSAPALELLDIMRSLTGNSIFVFPSPTLDDDDNQRPIDRRSFSRAMGRIVKALGIDNATPHDLRRTGATAITSERIGIARFVVSQVIAHAGDTGGAAAVTGRHYDLNNYLPDKRRALDAWGTLLMEIVEGKARAENVTSIGVRVAS